MAAPKRPNNAAAVEAARQLALQKRLAAAADQLRDKGYIVLEPDDAEALREHVRTLSDQQLWDNRAMFERISGVTMTSRITQTETSSLDHGGDQE
jgi:hypothetical protein